MTANFTVSEHGGVDDVALDIARTLPRKRLAAVASAWAAVRASETKPETGHVCICCNWGDTCVPWTLNDSVSPLLFCVMVV